MKKSLLLSLSVLLSLTLFAQSSKADTLGAHHNFFVNSNFDISARTSIPATLEYISADAYFYVDDSYLNVLNSFQLQTFDQDLISIAQDFDTNIYPKETSFWGSEYKPGIDNDPKVTILLERLSTGTGGYFDSINEYPLSQTADTNQREMIFVNSSSILNGKADAYVSHEFQHLIDFYQKDILHNVSEDTWLNELRSQYSVTLTGYNNDFLNSDLYQRELTFLQNPTDSLTEWKNSLSDYASITLFGNYLADRFGPQMLADTLHSAQTGIPSINEYLVGHGQTEKFGEVFGDWLWADFLNNRSVDPRFGYADPNLQSLHVQPTGTHYLNSSSTNYLNLTLKPWQPDWEKMIPDQSAATGENIKISWGNPAFEVFYGDASGQERPLQDGEVIAPPSPGTAFLLMPVNESKTTDFTSNDPTMNLNLTLQYVAQPVATPTPPAPAIKDGDLIIGPGETDIYVVTGKYKRLLQPAVLNFYGLDPAKAIHVSQSVFDSYSVSNYIRAVDQKKVYAIWPDGTKHWLNISAQTFTNSGRDWNSIFIVNDLEINFYKTGPDITQ